MRQHHSANQIVFEVKNGANLDGDSYRQTSYYLTDALGRLGFLVTRKSISKEYASHAVAIYHDQKKVVLNLCDDDLSEMLRLKESGCDPTELLQRHYDEFITLL